jgi:hypothetical protein
VLGLDAELDLGPKERMHAGEDGLRTLLLTLRDERGQPAVVPGLALELEPGGELPLKALEPGRWTAELAAPPAPGPREIIVRARWLGGALVAGRIAVERKLLERYVYRWREATLTASWDGDRTATQLPSVRPIDRVGTAIGIERRHDETLMGVMMRGEAALFDQLLGIDGSLTFFRLPLDRDDPATNELGDLVLGARYLVRQPERRLTLAPSLRARVPLGRFEGVAIGLEPAGLLRWRALERLWLDTRQGLYGAIGKRGEASYIGDYTLLWMPLGIDGVLAMTAQLDTQQGLSGGAFALAAGGGLALRIQRVRIGLQLGGGIGEGGRDRYGDLFGALTVDFGLGTP